MGFLLYGALGAAGMVGIAIWSGAKARREQRRKKMLADHELLMGQYRLIMLRIIADRSPGEDGE
jgi:hypothetical protein